MKDWDFIEFAGFVFFFFFLGVFAGIFNNIFSYIVKGIVVLGLVFAIIDFFDTILHTKKDVLDIGFALKKLLINFLFTIFVWLLPLVAIEIIALVISTLIILKDFII